MEGRRRLRTHSPNLLTIKPQEDHGEDEHDVDQGENEPCVLELDLFGQWDA